MSMVISPTLDGLASERLRALATQPARTPADGAAIRDLTRTESAGARRTPMRNVRAWAFEAASHLVPEESALDGITERIAWRFRVAAEAVARKLRSEITEHPS